MDRDMDHHSDRSPPMSPFSERDFPPGLTPHGLSHHGLHSPPSPNRPSLHPALYHHGQRSPSLPLHLAFDKTVYSSPPQASNKPENNQCRLIDYRSAKVAAFSVEGRELICLPQAFELFLKHLVGGLHTVYTKLKRLCITPVVCNVEQVRILRGLGAIQPGVNRCKLLAPKEFDVLYEDCTNSSARPGRPPKRAGIGPDEHFEGIKKQRESSDFYHHVPGRIVDPKKSALFPNGYHFPPYHLPFMSPLAHPAMMNLAMANHLGMRPDMIHAREALPADLSTRRNPDEKPDPHSKPSERHSPHHHDPEKPLNLGVNRNSENKPDHHHHHPMPALNHIRRPEVITNGQYALPRHLPQPVPHHEDSEMDEDLSDEEDLAETDDLEASANSADDFPFKKSLEAHAKSLGMPLPAHPAGGPDSQGNSAIETLLMNILGLLKVAIENARIMEEQAKQEKTQIKMEMIKEKETRESMEKQLEEEQKHIALLTKKLKRERRAARRLQDQLEQTSHVPQHRPHPAPQHQPAPHQPHPVPQQQQQQPPPPPPHPEPITIRPHNSDDDIKHTQEELKKLNELSNRVSPVEERKQYTPEKEANIVTSEPSSQPSEVHNAMESLIMSTQRLPTSCHGTANGYLHSPLIKQAEAV